MLDSSIGIGDWVIVTKRDSMDRSFLREPLEVKAIDGDMVLVKRLDAWGSVDMILDTTTQTIKRVSDDFRAKILEMREEVKKKEEARDRRMSLADDPQ